MVSLVDFFKDSKCILDFDIGMYVIDDFDKAGQTIKILTETPVQLNKVTIVSKRDNTTVSVVGYKAYIDFVYDYEDANIVNNTLIMDKFDHSYFNSTVTMYFVFNRGAEYYNTYHVFSL